MSVISEAKETESYTMLMRGKVKKEEKALKVSIGLVKWMSGRTLRESCVAVVMETEAVSVMGSK